MRMHTAHGLAVFHRHLAPSAPVLSPIPLKLLVKGGKLLNNNALIRRSPYLDVLFLGCLLAFLNRATPSPLPTH